MGLFDEEIDKQLEQSGHLLKLDGVTLNTIELFSGYGSQCLGLEYLGVKYKSHRTCEWAVNSILAYKYVHNPDDNTDYSNGLSKEELTDTLFNLGISFDYSNPATREQISRKSEDWMRTIYNAIKSCNNMVNICNVKAEDLGLEENEMYMMSYSYPCQDLSVAGLMKGMSRDSGTRSGLLWEVERILKECKELNNRLPQILLMENVPMVHSKDNIQDFNEWQEFLRSLGYHNYWQDLNAKDFVLPQNRQRTFMVSLLGDYCYNFPDKIVSSVRLKDLLEHNVDEKYYLSKKMVDYCTGANYSNENYKRADRFYDCLKRTNDVGIATTVTTNAGNRAIDNFILDDDYAGTYQFAKSDTFMHGRDRFQEQKDYSDTLQTNPKEGVVIVGNYSPSNHNASRVVDIDGLAPTVMENHGTVTAINLKEELCNKLIENNVVEEGDVIRHSYTHNRLDNGAKNMGRIESIEKLSPTLDTRCDCLGVCVTDEEQPQKEVYSNCSKLNQIIEENDIQDGDYIDAYNRKVCRDATGTILTGVSFRNQSFIAESKEEPQEESVYTDLEKSLFTEDGNIKKYIDSDIVYNFEEGQMATTSYPNGYAHGTRVHDESVTLNTIDRPSVKQNLRIRKLTPRECFRLMGVADRDSIRMLDNISNAGCYHLAGDSICTCAIMAIMSKFYNVNLEEKLGELLESIKDKK